MKNRHLILALAAAALSVLVAVGDTDAKRLGGGRSLGAQRQSVAPPAATTPGPAANPVMPAQPGASAAAKPAAPAAAAPSGASRWLGPIAGIAAGLGLAALLSHLGLSEEFGSLLLIGLGVLAIVFVVRLLLARRSATTPSYAGAAAAGSAAPTETVFRRVEPVLAPSPAASPSTNFAKPVPDGFDTAAFVREAKVQYRRLQAAWDAGDRKALAGVMTPEMAAEAARDLETRGAHVATEVVSLDAEVLEVTTEAGAHWASVRFIGLVREDGAPQPSPVDEIWNLTKPVDGSTGWLLAGIRQAS
jgi:predicted lipid-binding transport protein (Tim44 family)